jgi:DNA-binding response OmpR family regulator
VLRKLDPIHHKGVRLDLRTFAVCKAENGLCKAGLPTLMEMRDKNTMKIGIRILTNENHPTRSQMIKRNIYDDYAMKPGSPKHFFIRVAELLGHMDIDRRVVEKTLDYIIRPPWYTDATKGKVWIGLSVK